MSSLEASLFSSGRIGALQVANRVAMAPLTRSRADRDGVPSELAAEYYAQRASAGLIISEGTNISRQGRGYAFTPGIYTEAQVEAWRRITDAVHRADGRIVCQLWHVGRMSHCSLQEGGQAPVAPSVVPAGELVFLESRTQSPPTAPRALRLEEIAGVVADYRHAAIRARSAGFDGVEVHAANNYLLEQFLRDSTNRRTDRYGGSVANRTRLLLEVMSQVADVWGADRVGIRLSPLTRSAGNTPLDSDPQETYGHLVRQLAPLRLAYLHCIEGQTRGPNAQDDFDFGMLRRQFDGRYIANNGYDRELAMRAVASGHADMVSFGHYFISNPDLVERLRRNHPLAGSNRSTYYAGGREGYTDYPPFAGNMDSAVAPDIALSAVPRQLAVSATEVTS